MTKRTGCSMVSRKRKSLKAKRPMSDEALLASAVRAAAKHKKELSRGWLHSNQ